MGRVGMVQGTWSEAGCGRGKGRTKFWLRTYAARRLRTTERDSGNADLERHTARS